MSRTNDSLDARAGLFRRWQRRWIGPLFLVCAGFIGCTCQPTGPITSPSSSPRDPVSERISRPVISLGYSQQVAERLLDWVGTWKDGQGLVLLDRWADELSKARGDQTKGRTSPKDLARIERRVADRILELIRDQLRYDGRTFDLPDIIQIRETQCLGYVQLYWIVACAVDLKARPVDVLQKDRDHRLPDDPGHVCCAVTLTDHSTLLIDVVPNGRIYGPLVLGDLYVEQKGHLRLKDPSKASGLYQTIHLLDPQGLAGHLVSARAGRWITVGQYQQAADLYTQALDLAPDLAQIWGNRAVAFYRLGILDRAIADCNQALAMEADRPGPFNTRASVYVRQGRYEQALEDLHRALDLDDRSAMTLYNRGNVYTKLGQFDRAIQDYHRAIELEPSSAKTHLMLGNAYHRLGRYREAIARYTRAIRIDPSLELAYANRGMSYAKLGQRQDARQDLITAAKVDPSMAGYVAQASDRLDLGPLGSLRQSDSRGAR